MSAEPEVAPYGGFMVKSLEEETKQLNDLTNHQYEITTLEGKTETIRPESLKSLVLIIYQLKILKIILIII